MKVLPVTLGPIVGETTSTRVRLFCRAAYEATPEGPRRACGVARIRSVTGGFSDPVFFKMNPNFDLTGVVVFGSLEPETEHEYQMGYFFSNTEAAGNFTRVTVHPDRVEAEVFSRNGLPLGSPKVHRF